MDYVLQALVILSMLVTVVWTAAYMLSDVKAPKQPPLEKKVPPLELKMRQAMERTK